MASPTSPRIGGYSLIKVKRAGGEETPRFEAVLVKDATPIAVVSNSGEGGSHRVRPFNGGSWEAVRTFEAFAAAWNAGTEFAGVEDGDHLVYHLLDLIANNRSRKTLFLLDDEDERTAAPRAFKGAATREEVLLELRTHFADRNPRVWDKEAGAFIAL